MRCSDVSGFACRCSCVPYSENLPSWATEFSPNDIIHTNSHLVSMAYEPTSATQRTGAQDLAWQPDLKMPALLDQSKGQQKKGTLILGRLSEGQELQVYPWGQARQTTEGNIDRPYYLGSKQNRHHQVGCIVVIRWIS